MQESEIEEKLKQKVAGVDNKDLDWAWSEYHDSLEKAEENAFSGATEEMIQKQAIKMVRGTIVHGSRSGGTVEPVEVVAIGHGGVSQWSDGDDGEKDVLIAYGVVKPPEDPVGLGVFIFEETDGVDVYNVESMFDTLASLKVHVQVNESDELSGVYRLRSSEDTRVEEDSSDKDDAEKRKIIHNFVEDEAKIENIADYLSLTNEDGYAMDFGADLKRITCNVVDWFDGDGFNTYTVLDESVVDTDELGDDVLSDRGRTPGLTVWCPDEFFEYGTDSQLEIYGTLTCSEDGQVTMNAKGVFPLFSFEQEDESYGSGDSTDETNVSEEEI